MHLGGLVYIFMCKSFESQLTSKSTNSQTENPIETKSSQEECSSYALMVIMTRNGFQNNTLYFFEEIGSQTNSWIIYLPHVNCGLMEGVV
jgi:hypothetical protein